MSNLQIWWMMVLMSRCQKRIPWPFPRTVPTVPGTTSHEASWPTSGSTRRGSPIVTEAEAKPGWSEHSSGELSFWSSRVSQHRWRRPSTRTRPSSFHHSPISWSVTGISMNQDRHRLSHVSRSWQTAAQTSRSLGGRLRHEVRRSYLSSESNLST